MVAGKVIVVTGASSGIGYATAMRLASLGAIVVGLARKVERMEKITELVPENCFHARRCDMSKENNIIDAIAWAVTKFGTIDILINNAGVCEISSLVDGSSDQWRNMIDVNVLGLCVATRETLKVMKLHEKGHIVNINSIAGHEILHFRNHPIGIYSATKHAVTALTESLRLELHEAGSKIKVSSISPGSVYTEMYLKIAGENDVIPEGFRVSNDDFLDVNDVVGSIEAILKLPENVVVKDLQIQSIGKLFS